MPTARPTLDATRRDVTGKQVARLRRAGQLPAVVFGHGVASENLALDGHAFDLFRRHVSANALVDLKVDGERPRPVLVHGVQIDPLSRRPLHVDLFVVRMTEELTVDVPLVSTGTSEAVEVHGGTLLHVIEHVRVRALPAKLPETIEYAVDSLATFDAAIHVRDLVAPDGATILTDPDEIVAKVERPRVEVEEAPAAEAAPEPEAGAGAGPTVEAAATGEESTAG